ncbi:hypothetical protein ACN4EK_03665 [Pantanalinema rosaneae CENA516]|uniref:hypothetical protein n=1 Tax=Pantanalinema rosaneae TaxID=1620701 RepID=UPI003D7007AA
MSNLGLPLSPFLNCPISTVQTAPPRYGKYAFIRSDDRAQYSRQACCVAVSHPARNRFRLLSLPQYPVAFLRSNVRGTSPLVEIFDLVNGAEAQWQKLSELT